MKLVILDSFATTGGTLSLDGFSALCDSVSNYDRTSACDTIARIGDAEMVVTNKTVIDRAVLEACPNIKYIGLFSTGYNVIDIDYAKERGIVVANVPSYSTAGVSQLVFAFILSFFSMVDAHNTRVQNGEWVNSTDFCFYDSRISELAGKTLGIVGFGSIGKKVAQIANAFDMNVLVNSRTRYSEYEGDSLKFVSLDELYASSDVISLHCPLFKETERLINKDSIEKMKREVIIINTARGPIIDEQDLADALNNGRVRGAGVDVVSFEPIKANNPLLGAKNCIITPHIAWAGNETRDRLISIAVSNAKAFLAGNPQNNVAK